VDLCSDFWVVGVVFLLGRIEKVVGVFFLFFLISERIGWAFFFPENIVVFLP